MRVVMAVVVALAIVGIPVGARADEQPWVISMQAATLYAQPASDADPLGEIAPWAPLQVVGYEGEWAYVYNPRTRGTAYIQSSLLAPGEPPSKFVLMPPPAVTDEFQTRGVLTDETPLAVYPTWAEEAAQTIGTPNTWLTLDGMVTGDDGTSWYLTSDGAYVPVIAVFLPERTSDFGGRWLDVDLTSPARVTAYEGGEVVGSFLAIRGTTAFPTPVGTFTILRRVANETMNSDTIGIPRFGPGGYYLTNVLFTQYFTGSGASFHYNYWSGNWGYPGSHGCLGLTYGDSAWLWEWARIGTPVAIHY
jgi:hypothetical protein